MKDTSNELDKAGSHLDGTLLNEDSAILESLQVTIYTDLLKNLPSLVSCI
jgi:hypothetical protein